MGLCHSLRPLIYYGLNFIDMRENTDKFQLFSLPLSGHPAPATTEKKTANSYSRNMSPKLVPAFFTTATWTNRHCNINDILLSIPS